MNYRQLFALTLVANFAHLVNYVSASWVEDPEVERRHRLIGEAIESVYDTSEYAVRIDPRNMREKLNIIDFRSGPIRSRKIKEWNTPRILLEAGQITPDKCHYDAYLDMEKLINANKAYHSTILPYLEYHKTEQFKYCEMLITHAVRKRMNSIDLLDKRCTYLEPMLRATADLRWNDTTNGLISFVVDFLRHNADQQVLRLLAKKTGHEKLEMEYKRLLEDPCECVDRHLPSTSEYLMPFINSEPFTNLVNPETKKWLISESWCREVAKFKMPIMDRAFKDLKPQKSVKGCVTGLFSCKSG